MFMLKNERHFELVQKYPNFLLNTHINEFDPQTIQIKTTMKTHTLEMVTTWRKSINYLLIPANWLSICLCLHIFVPLRLFPIFICSSLCYALCPWLSSFDHRYHLYQLYHHFPLYNLSILFRSSLDHLSILSLSSLTSLPLFLSSLSILSCFLSSIPLFPLYPLYLFPFPINIHPYFYHYKSWHLNRKKNFVTITKSSCSWLKFMSISTYFEALSCFHLCIGDKLKPNSWINTPNTIQKTINPSETE